VLPTLMIIANALVRYLGTAGCQKPSFSIRMASFFAK
jgi:hypothetical protein